MKVPCVEIAHLLKKVLKERAGRLKKKGVHPKLTTFLAGDSKEQFSFVSIKKKVAGEIGVKFEFVHLKKIPPFVEFVNLLRDKAQDPTITGIIIQQPLPAHLHTATIYNFIPPEKELERHRDKSPHLPPLGLAVLTVLKYIFQKGKASKNLVIAPQEDTSFFKQVFKHKKIVLVGRGLTGGIPIGKTLSEFKINFININSRTSNKEQYYSEADIIVTAVGKKILTPDVIKQGVILINAGLRKEGNRLKGDYDESEIKNTASYYTETPKGIGPLDVLYLYKNLLDAAEMQKRSR